MKLTVSVAIVLSLAIACASRQPQPQMIVKNKVVAATPEQAFDAVVTVFGERNWPIMTIDRRTGLIASDWMQISRDPGIADCGDIRGPINRRSARLTVMVLVRDGLTVVRVNAGYREVQSNELDTWYADCVTMGGIEAIVHNGVVGHLQRAGITPPPTSALPSPAR